MTIVQHAPEIDAAAKMREDIINQVIKNVISANLLDSETKYIVNGTGRFVPRWNIGCSRVYGAKNHR